MPFLKNKTLYPYFFIVVACVGVFFPIATNNFLIWDDRVLVLTNKNVLNFDVVGMFTHLNLGGFFPLTQLSFSIDRFLFGLNPTAFHVENLLWHIANCILVYVFSKRIFTATDPVAIITTLVFAIHPLHVEPVAWVSGRKDLMSTFFYLSSLLAFHRHLHEKSTGHLFGGTVLFVLGLLSKAMVVTLPVILTIMVIRRQRLKQNWLLLAVLFTFSLAIGLLELKAQKTTLLFASESPTLLNGLNSVVMGMSFYLAKTFYPYGLSIYYDPEAFYFTVKDYIALVITAVTIASSLTRETSRARVSFPILFFLITIAPVLKLVPFGKESLFYDRYMYLPSVGLFFAVVVALERFFANQSKKQKWAALLIVLSLLGFGSYRYTETWHDSRSVWTNTLQWYPGTLRAHQILGLHYMTKSEPQTAATHFQKIFDVHPKSHDDGVNLAVALNQSGQVEKSIKIYLQLVENYPKSAIVLNNLAHAYLANNQPKEARQYFLKVLTTKMGSRPNIHLGIAKTFEMEGQLDRALKTLEAAPRAPEIEKEIIRLTTKKTTTKQRKS